MKSIYSWAVFSSLVFGYGATACSSGAAALPSAGEDVDTGVPPAGDSGVNQDTSNLDASTVPTNLCPAPRCANAPCASVPVETFAAGVQSIAANARELLVLVADTFDRAQVRALPRTGGSSTPVRTGWMNAIAADDTTLYWNRRMQGQGSNVDVVESAPLADPNRVAALASNENGLASLVVSQRRLFWGATTATGGFLDGASGTIRTLALDGPATPQTVATGFRLALGLAVVDEDLFFTNWNASGSVLRVRAAGGSPTVVAARINAPRELTALGDMLYFIAEGQLFAVPKTGGTPVVLASASSGLFAVEGALYFGVAKALHCLRP
jgi:hypothetical protein